MENDATELCIGKPATITTKDSRQTFLQTNGNQQQITNPGGWSPMLILVSVTCCLGSALPAGYNIGVVNNPKDVSIDLYSHSVMLDSESTTTYNEDSLKLMMGFCNKTIEERFNVQLSSAALDVVWSTVVSIFLVGGVTGSLSAGWLADKLGRRGALAIGNLFGIIGAGFFLCVKALSSVEVLMAGRLIVGLSGGLATSLVPMYITEAAPLRLRGAVGVICQLGLTLGVLLGQIISLDTVLGTEDSWHFMLAAFSPLCMISMALSFILPESPKYLYVKKGREEQAVKELGRLRNMDPSLLNNEIRSLDQEAAATKTTANWTIGRVLKDPTLRLPLILVCAMQGGQQLSGVNAVFYYSSDIFKKANLGETGAQLATLGTGVINFAMALVAMPVMSMFGRRTLFLTSCYSAITCLMVLCIAIIYIDAAYAMSILSIIAVLAYVLVYGIGLGPIPYFIGSELFDVGPRPAAMALGSVCNWGGNFIVGMAFPSLQSTIGAYSFIIFAGSTLLLALLNRFYLPETRGRDTMEISATMTKGLKSRPNQISHAS